MSVVVGSGNVAIQLSLRDHFDGAVLMAPMVKISDKMKPPQFIVDLLT